MKTVRVQTGWDYTRDEPIYEDIPTWRPSLNAPRRPYEGPTEADVSKVDAIMALLDV